MHRKSHARKMGVLLIVFLLILTSSMVAANAIPGSDGGSSASEKLDVLIGFNGQPNPGLVRAFGGEIYAQFSLVDVIAAKMTAAQIKALQKNPSISYIEPDSLVYAIGQEVPWGINRVFGNDANRIETWNISKGGGIGVAVLDTGIDYTHPDLRVVGGRRFYLQGISLKQDDRYMDGNGHGTHVAGTIAALDNDLGVVGVAPNVDLYAVKVLSDNGSGSTSAIIAGIEWTANHPAGISIINMSLGSSSYSKAFEDACNAAYSKGLLVVASAGNSGKADGSGDNVGYPAKYKSVIAVAASEITDIRAYFSSTGPDVELIAPGRNIYSTVPGGYSTYSGTSMASPHVAGAAAVVWAADPSLTNAELRTILQSTAEDLGLPLWHQGFGMVRADLAVSGIEPSLKYSLTLKASPPEGGAVNGSGDYSEGQVVRISATAAAGYEFVNWTKDGSPISSSANYDFTMPGEAVELVANFLEIIAPPSYQLMMEAAPGEGGSAYDDTGSGTYPEGTQISIRAVAASGYAFTGWSASSGSFIDQTNPNTIFTMPANDVTVTANFVAINNPESITASVSTDKQVYKWNTWVYITISVQDQNNAGVAGATAAVDVKYPNGDNATSFQGTTDSTGKIMFSYRIPNKSAIGDYNVSAVASWNTLTTNTAESTFYVSGR